MVNMRNNSKRWAKNLFDDLNTIFSKNKNGCELLIIKNSINWLLNS